MAEGGKESNITDLAQQFADKVDKLLSGAEFISGRRIQGFDVPGAIVEEWTERHKVASSEADFKMPEKVNLIVLSGGPDHKNAQIHIHPREDVTWVYQLNLIGKNSPKFTAYENLFFGREGLSIPVGWITREASASEMEAFNKFLDHATPIPA